ncbi:MAG: hypothetical protein CVV25_09095 [Ignavibacteriae bacterium HGW-Ignavibacteriae-4]|nr:MAG: hypothetical protein CVV25_09095 [Ignavibacteriae bacterium HGW-Ignavibacteriae-4]
MRILIFVYLFISSFSFLLSEPSAEDYLKMGINEHDKGNYESALKFYNKVLETGELLEFVYYEKGMTYSVLGNHEKSLEMGDLLIENATRDEMEAMGYMLKGNALDNLGKPLEAIEEYREGIDETDFFMLHFNIGITYMRLDMDSLAAISLANAAKKNLLFSSSHYYLGIINYEGKQKAKSILSALFFLQLPQIAEDRKVMAYQNLLTSINIGVDRESSSAINVTLFTTDNSSQKFKTIDFLISLKAIDIDSSEVGLLPSERLKDYVETIVQTFEELDDDNFDLEVEQFLYDYYIKYFLEVREKGHFETLVHIACSVKEPESGQWVIDNRDKVRDYYKFFKNYFELE